MRSAIMSCISHEHITPSQYYLTNGNVQDPFSRHLQPVSSLTDDKYPITHCFNSFGNPGYRLCRSLNLNGSLSSGTFSAGLYSPASEVATTMMTGVENIALRPPLLHPLYQLIGLPLPSCSSLRHQLSPLRLSSAPNTLSVPFAIFERLS